MADGLIEGKMYTSSKEWAKDNSIIYEIDTDVTYDIFRKDKRFKKIIKEIVEGGWYDIVKEHVIFNMNYYLGGRKSFSFSDYFDYDDDKTVFSYILFQTLYNKQDLYVVYQEFNEEIYIVNRTKLPDVINIEVDTICYITLISKLLIDIKSIFLGYDAFKSILNKCDVVSEDKESNVLDNKIDIYIQFIEDLKNLQFISEEFKNCRISLKIKDGEPFYMEAETKTIDTDFQTWKKKLGNERKIEENVHDDRAISLMVTKKFKYKNKDKASEDLN